jgi:hypothetical protein
MKMEVWCKADCEKCGAEVGWENLTQGGLCEQCEYEGEI